MIAQPQAFVRRSLLLALVLAGLAACSGAPQRPGGDRYAAATPVPVRSAGPDAGSRAAGFALQQVGTPYRYGGSSPSGFDCSGLVHYSYAAAGKPVPRTSAAQYARLAPVAGDAMRAGDVLFFRIEGKMSHVGLYLGDGRFVHAPSSGRTVTVDSLRSDFYSDAFIRAGRPK